VNPDYEQACIDGLLPVRVADLPKLYRFQAGQWLHAFFLNNILSFEAGGETKN
jgi:hypothetical protein